MSRTDTPPRHHRAARLLALLGGRPLVLIGMMGAGKTTVGRRIAAKLDRQFFDSDEEIEKAAQMDIAEIFRTRGEAEFRAGETRVIARVLKDSDIVLATGGGAFVHPDTRTLVNTEAVSVWIKADFELLFARVSRRSNRPLLRTENPRATLQKLIEDRYPIYAEAHVTVVSRDVHQDAVANDIIEAVIAYLEPQDSAA